MDKTGRDPEKLFNHMHQHWRRMVTDMTGSQDIRGIELVSAIRMLANLYDHAVSQSPAFSELSGPRLGILMRLLAEENLGNHNGINPTLISHYQNVQKNTISSLLKGLEDQGLIERVIDPADKRGFLIRITPAGRDLVKTSAPARLEFTNRLASGLTDQEQDQLIGLLEKLRASLFAQGCKRRTGPNSDDQS